jgi:hypothetical protein
MNAIRAGVVEDQHDRMRSIEAPEAPAGHPLGDRLCE